LITNKENQWQPEPLQVIPRLFQFTCGHIKLKQKEINEEVVNKIKDLKQRKGIRKDQNKSIIHLPKLNKWFEEALKRKIKLHSTKNGLLMQLRLLVNGSTTILE
jgi:hypothetical protein